MELVPVHWTYRRLSEKDYYMVNHGITYIVRRTKTSVIARLAKYMAQGWKLEIFVDTNDHIMTYVMSMPSKPSFEVKDTSLVIHPVHINMRLVGMTFMRDSKTIDIYYNTWIDMMEIDDADKLDKKSLITQPEVDDMTKLVKNRDYKRMDIIKELLLQLKEDQQCIFVSIDDPVYTEVSEDGDDGDDDLSDIGDGSSLSDAEDLIRELELPSFMKTPDSHEVRFFCFCRNEHLHPLYVDLKNRNTITTDSGTFGVLCKH